MAEFDCECNMFACHKKLLTDRLRVTKDYDGHIVDSEYIPESIEKCEIRQSQLYKISQLAIKLSTLKKQYGIEE
jgi:hypothetical protein